MALLPIAQTESYWERNKPLRLTCIGERPPHEIIDCVLSAFMFHIFFSNVEDDVSVFGVQVTSMDCALRSSEQDRLLIYSYCEGITS